MAWQIKALAAVLCFAAGWAANGWRLGAHIVKMEAAQHADLAAREAAARKDELQTATKETHHAADTIQNADALTAGKNDAAERLAAAIADAERVRADYARRAATYRAQAAADATARSALADKAAALDASLADGRHVVAVVRGSLEQRDKEVSALCEQVNIERRLMGDTSNSACSK